jgi:hypothetical protein
MIWFSYFKLFEAGISFNKLFDTIHISCLAQMVNCKAYTSKYTDFYFNSSNNISI